MKPYYEDGCCAIYHGDSVELMDAFTGAEAVITDPPYGVGLNYDEHDDRDDGSYWPWMRDVVHQMRRTAKTTVFTHRIAALKHLVGWDWLGVWNKPNAMSGLNSMPIMPHWEPIFLYDIKRTALPRGFDVFSHNPEMGPRIGHPCVKPLSLYRELVRRFGNGGSVLDPFMGSGTTLRAAKDLGVKAIGIEKSEAYCELAARIVGQEVLDFGGVA